DLKVVFERLPYIERDAAACIRKLLSPSSRAEPLTGISSSVCHNDVCGWRCILIDQLNFHASSRSIIRKLEVDIIHMAAWGNHDFGCAARFNHTRIVSLRDWRGKYIIMIVTTNGTQLISAG